MPTLNQTPEQQARDNIDRQLQQAGWSVQDKNRINWNVGPGVAVRHYMTQDGKEADYVLFVNRKPVGLIEAKKEEEGHRLTVVEEQSGEYATSKLKYLNNDPLAFVYESTGVVTRFTDTRDPKPRSRPVFTFHRPETFAEWLKQPASLRGRLLDLPNLPVAGLRDCQVTAITRLEDSFKQNRPRALIQMATGSGKTFTAITFIYRLLKYAGTGRVLFLVDTKNLGEQAEQEFMGYLPNDDNRTFTELYNVHRLRSRYIPPDNQVYLSTIQRLYAILKGEELDETMEEENPAERGWQPKGPLPVVYNPQLPLEFFDFIVVDECHRSIYNLWKQVLDYFDSFLIGLTATPDKRTFAFFNENVVSEYTHEQAITDGVNVGSKTPWTQTVWIYDFRTNIHFTLKKDPLKYEDLADFITCYNPANRHERRETWSEQNPEGRWRKFSYEEISARDKTNLDIFWLKDKSLADLDNLPDPDILAGEIIENIEAALEGFKDLMESLNGSR